MIQRWSFFLLCASASIAVCAEPTQSPAASGPPKTPPAAGALELRTDRVVVFKDGYALVVKTAEGVVDADGEVHTNEVPEGATLGSFWAFADHHATLSMRAEQVDHADQTSKVSATSLAELLSANLGRTVTLELLPQAGPARPPVRGTVLEASANLVVIDGEGGRRALLVSELSAVIGPSLETKVSAPSLHHDKRLSFVLGSEEKGRPVRIHLLYFTEGLRWIPTYRISGKLEKEAELSLQGELLNEVEDLNGTAIDLVVGVPSFKFKSVPSPLTLEPLLRNALASAAPDLMGLGGQVISNALFSQRAGEIRAPVEAPASAFSSLPPELAGSSNEQDFYVYRVPSVRLKKGGRATLPLLSTQVAVKHLYSAKLHLGSNTPSPVTNPVWHELELSNAGNVPWTTGPAMMLRGEVPLGQDLLTYTPAGGRATLPITTAVEITAEVKHQELDRKANDFNWGGHSYARLTERSTIVLHNAKKETVHLKVTADLNGRVEKTSREGHPLSLGGSGVNPQSEIAYELLLEPDETRTLSADSVVYVP